VNWEETLRAAPRFAEDPALRAAAAAAVAQDGGPRFEDFERFLAGLYAEFTFERAAAESQVDAARIREAAEAVAEAGPRLAAHVWRAAAIANRGGWQVARCLFLLNVLTGSVGARGGTGLSAWNKFVPESPLPAPPPPAVWNELHFPDEWPLSCYEMSFVLPHLLLEGRGSIDVYFTRVYNPLWTNPDGFSWLEVLKDESKIACHVALTPTWNETAWFADWVLPMGHASERHDVMSQETHDAQWVAFRQPVRRVLMERQGRPVRRSYEANPGEVWEEAEFWVDLAFAMDPDGALGVRRFFESPARPGEPVTMDEYFSAIFEHGVPGLPDAAAKEGLTPLQFMRKYGAFEVKGASAGKEPRTFPTPTGKLEFYSPTMADWGWPEQRHVIPWPLPSHVAPENIDRARGEMLLLPNFRLPTLIHTRSANSKWLYEISHRNPVWMNPEDGARIGVSTGELVRVKTEIGWFVDSVWLTEGIKPGIVAVSHHLGRWRLADGDGPGGSLAPGMSNLVRVDAPDSERRTLTVLERARAWASADPDTARVNWRDVGVHQNLVHGVHPDPISGAHCWHQKALSVRRAAEGENAGDVHVDLAKSRAVFRQWRALTRPASLHSPDGNRRPAWLKRPLRPAAEAWKLPVLPR
jgi:anaerobic selenocysteine-containing dehydrogenase